MQFREINVQIQKIIVPNNLLKIKKNIIELNPILENQVIQSCFSQILEISKFIIYDIKRKCYLSVDPLHSI